MSEPQALRRLYTAVETRALEGGGFGVALDARALRTPAKAIFQVPTLGLAAACAAEWAGQGEAILPDSMPLTRLANVAIDRAAPARAAMIEAIAGYAGTDLISYRAAHPEALIARQSAAWDPLLAWAHEALGASLPRIVGVAPAATDPQARAAIAGAAAALGDFELTAAAHAIGLAGSCVIGLALAAGRLNGRQAYACAALDEVWQLETWGEDGEARARLLRLERDFLVVEQFFALLRNRT